MTDSQFSEASLSLLRLLAGGKTKRVFENPQDKNQVYVVSGDDITAGDGAKHDVIATKGALSTRTTTNVFGLLKRCGIPVAFDRQVAPNVFLAPACQMLPYEVVVRREGYGSSLKRRPYLKKGHIFPKLVVEFFLKTKGRKWKQYDLPCDDPLMVVLENDMIALYEPSKPFDGSDPFLLLHSEEVHSVESEETLYPEMAAIAVRAFLALEKAWQQQGGKLVDFKVEFGIDSSERLLLADVIDSDSWRVIIDGKHVDKQAYREGAALDEVLEKFRLGMELTSRFGLPTQQVVIWTGSPSDDTNPIEEAIAVLSNGAVGIKKITCSAHKEPILASEELHAATQEVPDSVIIALIGRSNGAGPTLSACTTVPVITIPANFDRFPEDVWSSLRSPSDVPVMTVLDSKNAVLAALNILALNSPLLYMRMRERLEKRLVNVVRI